MSSSTTTSRPDLADVIGAVAQSPQISFVVDANLRLAYCNQAWDRFAVDNAAPELAGASVVGTDLRCAIGEDLRPFYMQAFETVEREGSVWECLYECSSPQRFRKFQMRIHLLAPSGWFLVTNSLLIERPHAATISSGLEDFVNPDGIVTVCMHCRCSRRAAPPEQWDFVPAHLDRNLSNISHGLCPLCLEYFYPKSEGRGAS